MQQIDTLIYLMYPQAADVSIVFRLSPADSKRFVPMLQGFEFYFISKSNVIIEQAKFNTRVVLGGESVEEVATAMHTLAETCRYGSVCELIRDRLAVGLQNEKVSKSLQLALSLNFMVALIMAR